MRITLRDIEQTNEPFRGSLWLPYRKTFPACRIDQQLPQFFRFLIRIDEELAVRRWR